ncbi:MAG: response regulator [Chloroflexi bacterium]|nr:response regulator [Chloroflexota bacterium]
MAHILIVEDDPSYAMVLQTFLHSRGDQSSLATSWEEMTVLLSSRRTLPDAIVLDWRLPRGGGAQALGWLQGLPQMRAIPVLVLTAANDPRVGPEALRRGASAFLPKAIEMGVVYATLERIMTIPDTPTGLRVVGTQALRPGRSAVPLTPSQVEMLRIILEHPEITPHAELESRLMAYQDSQTERGSLLRMRVKRLNQRLKPLGAQVRSRRGQGYYLEAIPD